MSQEILDICREIKTTVEAQPSRKEMRNIALDAAREAISDHEARCFVRADYPDIKQTVGRLQGSHLNQEISKVSPVPDERKNKALISIGVILGAGIPIGIALWGLIEKFF